MALREAAALLGGIGLAVWLWWWPEWALAVGLAASGTALWAWHRTARLGDLARDLHDGLGGHLAALVLAADSRTEAGGANEIRERAEDALTELRHVLASLNRRLDLEVAVRAEGHRAAARSGWKLECEVVIEGPPPRETLRLEVLRCLQELLSNAARHAEAQRVRVQLVAKGGWLILTVEDDGRGFDPDVDAEGLHFGLRHLRERARRHRGALVIETPSEGGSRVCVRLRTQSWRPFGASPGIRRQSVLGG